MWFMKNLMQLVEKNMVPDFLIRKGTRTLLQARLDEEEKHDIEAQQAHLMRFVASLKKMPIAVNTRDANEQHYELPTEFFLHVLGKRLKYSSCYFPAGITSLDQAEEVMLAKYAERAQLADGQEILELGCGWGSCTLYMAEKFPKARITGVSNSRSQKEHIDGECKKRGLSNVTIVTADMNEFEAGAAKFDRVVSIEMFEHMKNYELLMRKVAKWLKPGGMLFVHIFTHARYAYHFEARDESDWMSKYFFTGGTMPSDNLLTYFQEDLALADHWRVSGTHYGKTSEAWLANLDAKKKEVWPILEATYGKENATKWFVYWRLFFIACAECFAFAGGNEWLVSHYLFRKRA
eukprot:tig00000169_g11904.t1